MTVIGKGSGDIDTVTKALVAGKGDKKTVKLQSYRGPTVSMCPRQSSHAHMILRPYIAAQNDREKNNTIDNSFLKVIKSTVDKEILNQALEDEDNVSSAINFTLSSTYKKLRALPPKCKDVVDFKTLFSSNDPKATLGDKVKSLMKDGNTAEDYLEQTGLAHYFKTDSGDDKITSKDLLETPLVTIKQRRENALQMQAAHITSHILDAKGLKTDMSINQKEDGSLSIGLKKQGSDASETSVVSYSDYSKEQNENLVREAEGRFKKFKKDHPPSGIFAYLNPQGFMDSAVEQFSDVANSQKADIEERAEGLLDFFTNKAGAAVMGLAGATALIATPFLAPSFGIAAAGAVGVMGAAALGMSMHSYFNPKKDEAKADNRNDDEKNRTDSGAGSGDGAGAGDGAGSGDGAGGVQPQDSAASVVEENRGFFGGLRNAAGGAVDAVRSAVNRRSVPEVEGAQSENGVRSNRTEGDTHSERGGDNSGEAGRHGRLPDAPDDASKSDEKAGIFRGLKSVVGTAAGSVANNARALFTRGGEPDVIVPETASAGVNTEAASDAQEAAEKAQKAEAEKTQKAAAEKAEKRAAVEKALQEAEKEAIAFAEREKAKEGDPESLARALEAVNKANDLKTGETTENSGGGWLGRTAQATVKAVATPFAGLAGLFGGGANQHPAGGPNQHPAGGPSDLEISIHGDGDQERAPEKELPPVASEASVQGDGDAEPEEEGRVSRDNDSSLTSEELSPSAPVASEVVAEEAVVAEVVVAEEAAAKATESEEAAPEVQSPSDSQSPIEGDELLERAQGIAENSMALLREGKDEEALEVLVSGEEGIVKNLVGIFNKQTEEAVKKVTEAAIGHDLEAAEAAKAIAEEAVKAAKRLSEDYEGKEIKELLEEAQTARTLAERIIAAHELNAQNEEDTRAEGTRLNMEENPRGVGLQARINREAASGNIPQESTSSSSSINEAVEALPAKVAGSMAAGVQRLFTGFGWGSGAGGAKEGQSPLSPQDEFETYSV